MRPLNYNKILMHTLVFEIETELRTTDLLF